jgi:hypothetical protein
MARWTSLLLLLLLLVADWSQQVCWGQWRLKSCSTSRHSLSNTTQSF